VADSWSPEQYRLFHEQRLQPLRDLLELVDPTGVSRAVDLGCGPGEMTQLVAERVPHAVVTGVDNSCAMLESAQSFASDRVRFEEGDLAEWFSPDGVDLIVANASLHWAPQHDRVLGHWTTSLRPGGQLAVQVPANGAESQHRVALALAEETPFVELWGPAGPPPDVVIAHVLTPNEYARLLHRLGYVDIEVSLRVYPHVLPSTRHVVEWVKGTTLTRFRPYLSEEQFHDFVTEYEGRLLAELGEQAPYFFPFSRILFHARRPN
jgi:trans-aconitate 2-methyltransferase